MARPPGVTGTAIERFWKRVEKAGPDDCWLMLGDTKTVLARIVTDDGRRMGAHCFAYERFVGPIPPGFFVCHRCDTPKCVNPAHLFLGRPLDNMRDKINKGRQRVPHGSEHGMAKLTEAQVLEIRRRYAAKEANQYQLADEYGMSQPIISDIVRRKLWAHL